MLKDWAYHLIVSLLETFMWDGELVGEENLRQGPGVIVANHMGSVGPVGICVAMPMRLYPWVLGTTIDLVKGPDNVRKDFVEKILHLKPPLSGAIARGICRISTPLLLSIGCIPVPDTHAEQEATFQTSIELLKQGNYLYIVPEDPQGEPVDPLTGVRPFKRGFLRLGELYFRATGDRLPFYPVAIHEAGLVLVGKPIEYNPLNEARMERYRMVNLLEKTIKAMHLEVTQSEALEPLFSRRKIS
ncbi:MAG: lysophospholipid acyltransferase family protein [Acidobacteriaceae bacterium]